MESKSSTRCAEVAAISSGMQGLAMPSDPAALPTAVLLDHHTFPNAPKQNVQHLKRLVCPYIGLQNISCTTSPAEPALASKPQYSTPTGVKRKHEALSTASAQFFEKDKSRLRTMEKRAAAIAGHS